ncbi:unnamed protein product [Caenorhabditis angaria]|uniref:Uncharacterized protein n=1 Tax=Caenorhabditis angaria TaxID=860376 RepID=A0A9P1ILJ8_9PELO|nr:unnamed protein product [Caenorhabditis angaria]
MVDESLAKLRKLSAGCSKSQEKELDKIATLNTYLKYQVPPENLDEQPLRFMTFNEKRRFFECEYPGKKSPGQLRRGREALKAICDNLENYSDFDERESPDEISISPPSRENLKTQKNAPTSRAFPGSELSDSSRSLSFEPEND